MSPAAAGSPLASRTSSQWAGQKRGWGGGCRGVLGAGECSQGGQGVWGGRGVGSQTETPAMTRPQLPDISAGAARGLEEAALPSGCAELRAIFSSSAEELRWERLSAAGRAPLPRPQDLDGERFPCGAA